MRTTTFILFLASTLTLSATLISYEGVAYEPTNMLIGLNGGAGWTNAWTGNNDVLEGGLNYPGLLTQSNRFAVDALLTSTRASFRNPATNGFGHLLRTDGRFGRDGIEIWISLLMRPETSDFGTYAGLSLFNDSIEQVFVGKPFLGEQWGMHLLVSGGGVSLSDRRLVKGETVLLVAKVTFGPSTDRVDLFLNPQPGVLPATPAATRSVSQLLFNRVRLEGGSAGIAAFDEIRLGETYADVTPVVSEFAAVWSAPGTNVVTGSFTNRLLLAEPGGVPSNLGVVVTSENTNLVPAQNIVITGSGHERTVAFLLPPNQIGQSLITATVTNLNGQTTSSQFLLDLRLGGLRPAETVRNTDHKSFGLTGLRDGGRGTLAVTGLVGTITRALLYWNGPENSLDPTNNAHVRFAGVDLVGTNIGLSSDNCWLYNHSHSYRADVTALVSGNGNYVLTNFWKPSAPRPLANINGVSLLVFYDDGISDNNQDILIYEGNDSNHPNAFEFGGWRALITDIPYTTGPAHLGLHVSDGQAGTGANDGNLTLNRQAFLSGPIFNGNTVPRVIGAAPNLWDIRTEEISRFLTNSGGQLLIELAWTNLDCVSLVVATVAVPALPPPTLRIEPGPPNLANLCWAALPGYELFNVYETSSLSPPSWSQVLAPRVTNNNRFVVEVPAAAAARFFRLQNP